MKRIVIFWLMGLCWSLVYGQSPEKLYISTQTGEYTTIEGSGTASTDEDESGECECSKTGPIIYNISPLSIGNSESLTVEGEVYPDSDNAPAAGDSASASITCDCEWTWQKWKGLEDGVDYHYDTTGYGSETKDYKVYSLHIEISGDSMACEGDTLVFTAKASPGGGTITWSDFTDGETMTRVAPSKDFTVYAVYDIEGVTYKAEHSVKVGAPGSWEFSDGPPAITQWQDALNNIEVIKKTADKIIKKLPFDAQLKGPTFSYSHKKKNCCKASEIIINGLVESTGTIKATISAEDVSVPILPYSGDITKYYSKYGFLFELKIIWGLRFSIEASASGSLTHSVDSCKSEECFKGELGLGLSGTAKVGVKIEGKFVSSNVSSCKTCGVATVNLCGYCDNHTYKSWWCLPTVSVELDPANITFSISGAITYNDKSCTSGLDAKASIGPVVFTSHFKVYEYSFDWSYTVIKKLSLYP